MAALNPSDVVHPPWTLFSYTAITLHFLSDRSHVFSGTLRGELTVAADVLPLAWLLPAVLPDTPGGPAQTRLPSAQWGQHFWCSLHRQHLYSSRFTACLQVKQENRDLLLRTAGHEARVFSATGLWSSPSSSVSLIVKLRTGIPTEKLGK